MFAKQVHFLLQIFFPISYHSESLSKSHYLQESCFNDMFVKIQILIHSFPLDHRTEFETLLVEQDERRVQLYIKLYLRAEIVL